MTIVKKAYDYVDEKTLKACVAVSVFAMTLPMPALAQGGGQQQGNAFQIDKTLGDMTGYNSKNVAFDAKAATGSASNAGTLTINIFATLFMVVGFLMVGWGIYSLKSLADQQASPADKRKAWVLIAVGALMAIPTLLYAVFAVVAGTALTKSGTL